MVVRGGKEHFLLPQTTIQNRQANIITRLKDDEGNTVENHNEIEASLLDHFKNIMAEPQIDRNEAQDEVMANIPSLVMEK